MSDVEPAPVEEQDQPTTEPPAPETDKQEDSPEFFSENFDPSTLAEELQPAYKQLQADYTRKTQSLAEQRKEYEQTLEFVQALQDPETQAEALAALGFDFEDEGQPDDVPDPQAQMLSEWEQFKQVQQEQQREQELDALEKDLEDQIAAATPDLSDEERSLVFDHGLALPHTPEGGMDIAAAVKSFEAAQQKAVDRYLASKRVPKAPSGAQGSPVVDLKDSAARVAHMAALMEAGRDD